VQKATCTRVQDLNNRFITGTHEIMRTGPDGPCYQKGTDAIAGADAALSG
jgi:hypothetical protein